MGLLSALRQDAEPSARLPLLVDLTLLVVHDEAVALATMHVIQF